MRHVLNKKKPEEVGAAHIGSLLLRQEGAVPIALDVKELVSTHVAILAGTGSGEILYRRGFGGGIAVAEKSRRSADPRPPW